MVKFMDLRRMKTGIMAIIACLAASIVFAGCKENDTTMGSIDLKGVYVVGGREDAKLWIDGKAQNLTGGVEAYSVYVSGENVYVAGVGLGQDGYAVAMLWKNGIAQTLAKINANNAVAYF